MICWFAKSIGGKEKADPIRAHPEGTGTVAPFSPRPGKAVLKATATVHFPFKAGQSGTHSLTTGKRPPKGRAGPTACGSNHYEQFVPCVSRSVTFCLGRLLWPLQVHSSSWCHTGSPMVFSAMSLMLALSLSPTDSSMADDYVGGPPGRPAGFVEIKQIFLPKTHSSFY